MFEFNPDGSIKVPEHLRRREVDAKERLRSQRCIIFKKEVLSFEAPKKCCITMTLSDKIQDSIPLERAFKAFSELSQTRMRFYKAGEKEFSIEIGTSFRRCTECNSLIERIGHVADASAIVHKGSCTFHQREFCEEDYFE